ASTRFARCWRRRPAMATDPTRRRWLVGGVAAAAAAAGGVLAWRRQAPGEAAAGADDPLWSQEFQTPAGGLLTLASLRGKPLPVSRGAGADGRIRQRRMGQLTAEQLRAWKSEAET